MKIQNGNYTSYYIADTNSLNRLIGNHSHTIHLGENNGIGNIGRLTALDDPTFQALAEIQSNKTIEDMSKLTKVDPYEEETQFVTAQEAKRHS